MNQNQLLPFLNNVLILNIKKNINENELKNYIISNTSIKLLNIAMLDDPIKNNNQMKKAKITLNSKDEIIEIKSLLNFKDFNGSELMVQEILPKNEIINQNTIFFNNLKFKKGLEFQEFFEKYGAIKYLELKHNFDGEYLGKGILIYESINKEEIDKIIDDIKKLKPNINIVKYQDNYISQSEFTLYIKNFPKEWENQDIIEKNLQDLLKDIKITRKMTNEFIKNYYYCLISFENQEDKEKSLEILNKISGLYVTNYKTKKDRYYEVKNNLMDKKNIKSIFLKNLKDNITEEDIKKVASKYGEVVSIFINKEKKFGSIKFNSFEECCEILKQKNSDNDLKDLFSTLINLNNNITFYLEKIQRDQMVKNRLNHKALMIQNTINNQFFNSLKPKVKEEIKFSTLSEIKNNFEEFKNLSSEKKQNSLGSLIYPIVNKFLNDKNMSQKITGILIDFEILKLEEMIEIIENEARAKEFIDEAVDLIKNND